MDESAGSRIHAPLERPARTIAEPFQDFISAQGASGWALLSATLVALAWANSPLGSSYQDLIHLEFGLQLGSFELNRSLQHWVNDGLMAIFFFLLGLELKRELLVGQLSELRRLATIGCAAAGGMLLPVLLFLIIADTGAISRGWGIPVATDTAFALTVLLLLGDRVPASVRAMLVGLAIVDDIGAILIIAVAYSTDLRTEWLWPALATIALLSVLNAIGVRRGLAYFVIGCVLWLEFLYLGLHGTLAGVVVAAIAPVRPAIARDEFVARVRAMTQRFQRRQDDADAMLEQPEQQELAREISTAADEATPPLNRWEMRLEHPVSLLVMPLFAFMNAGVSLSYDTDSVESATALGVAVAAGLVVGKPVGILMGVWLGLRTGLAALPPGLTLRHVIGIGLLGGIGFTMSIFIATLSYEATPALLEVAKRSIIVTSAGAGILGYLWLRLACAPAGK